MMLEAKMRDVIAEGEKEMIIAIMSGAEKLAGFGNQIGHSALHLGTHVERGGAVGHDIDFVMNRFAGGGDVEDTEVSAGDEGRTHEPIQCHGFEGDLIAGLIRYFERSAELP